MNINRFVEVFEIIIERRAGWLPHLFCTLPYGKRSDRVYSRQVIEKKCFPEVLVNRRKPLARCMGSF